MTRVARSLLAAGLALGGGLVALAPAAEAAACSTTSGVTVVVSSPAGTSTRCASGDPSSGLSALSGAGYSVVQMSRQPGFVCRIDGYPSSAVDSCVQAGTQSTWTYYHARRGGSWQYSSEGAASYDPAPGSVEGWGWGGPPSVAPPAAVVTPTPKPSTSSPRPSTTSTPAPKPTTSTRTSSRAATTSTTSRSTSASPTGTSPTSTTALTGTTDSTASAPSTTGAVVAGGPIEPTSSGTSGGTPWPFVGGAGLVAALGTAAAYGARRRRVGQH
ncbi:MAG: hypothetical protein ABI131_03100 [Nostocoides sp.]